MNQNTTIETIREAINKIRLSRVCSGNHLVSCGFCSENMETTENNLQDLANRLEAAPQQTKEQPPVEQSEPKSGVWIDGEWREIVLSGDCPECRDYHDRQAEHPSEQHGCQWRRYEAIVPRHPTKIAQRFWLAPPAVCYMSNDAINWIDNALAEYRRIRSRKGDK